MWCWQGRFYCCFVIGLVFSLHVVHLSLVLQNDLCVCVCVLRGVCVFSSAFYFLYFQKGFLASQLNCRRLLLLLYLLLLMLLFMHWDYRSTSWALSFFYFILLISVISTLWIMVNWIGEHSYFQNVRHL